MSILGTVIVGVVIAIGVVGAVVQIWPSSPLIGGAILVWAWMSGTRAAWVVLALTVVILTVGTVLKYVIPARGMSKAGIPQSTLIWGGIGGLMGWFLGLPVGLLLGMIAAIFLVEYLRSREASTAWKSTLHGTAGPSPSNCSQRWPPRPCGASALPWSPPEANATGGDPPRLIIR